MADTEKNYLGATRNRCVTVHRGIGAFFGPCSPGRLVEGARGAQLFWLLCWRLARGLTAPRPRPRDADTFPRSARVNMVLYAGVLAPNAKLRAEVVRYARPEPLPEPPATETQTRAERETWAALMRVTFALDALACPRCGGRMKHLGTILDARVARRILMHLGKPARAPPELPARDPPPFWEVVDAWS